MAVAPKNLFRAAAIVVVLAWCLNALLAIQNLRAYMPIFDLIPDQGNAYALAERMHVPDRGCISSFGGWNPPGVTYAFLPGVIFIPEDPWLGEKIGALMMWAITLAGFWVVMNRINNPLPIVFTVMIYSISADGVFYSSSLWPRAHPAFFIWFVYFLVKWISDREPAGLAAAILVWALGMYWFMEIAPLIAVVPVAWLLFRPPVRTRPLLLAAMAFIMTWSPFLLFQVQVGGFDLKRNLIERNQPLSQDDLFAAQVDNPDLTRITTRPAGWNPDWRIDPEEQNSEHDIDHDGRFIQDSVLGMVWSNLKESEHLGGVGYWFNLLDQNKVWAFQRLDDGAFYLHESNQWKQTALDHYIHSGQTITPETKAVPLRMTSALLHASMLRIFPWQTASWWACLLGVSAMSGCLLITGRLRNREPSQPREHGMMYAGSIACLAAMGGGLWGVGFAQPAGAFWVGASGLLACHFASRLVGTQRKLDHAGSVPSPPATCGKSDRPDESATLVTILFLSFGVPYLITAALIAPEEWSMSDRRFFWLTGGGCALVASSGWWITHRLPAGRLIYIILASLLFWGSLRQSDIYHALPSWISSGFAFGQQHESYDVMDWLAEDIQARRIKQPSIGYDVSFPAWLMMHRHYANGVYKIGMDFDFVLSHRYGIKNRNRLAEGISHEDDYRIVEIRRWDPPWDWPFYFDFSSYPRMELVRTWDQYALLRKPDAPTRDPNHHRQP